MAEESKPLDWLKGIGVTIHEVLRYGYGGLLALLAAALVSPEVTKKTIESLGATLSVIIAFALGGAIYAIQRPLSEPLFWLHEIIHMKIDKQLTGRICRTAWLVRQWNVNFFQAFDAFRVIRDDEQTFSPVRQKRFYLQHSELHTVYVTFWVLFAAAIAAWASPSGQSLMPGWAFPVLALLSLACGIFGNILLCNQECKVCLQLPGDKVEGLLVNAEFIRRPTPKQEAISSEE